MITLFHARFASLFVVATLASGCSVTPQEYKDETPVMDMKTYFSGPIEAWGLFQNYRDKVVKRFHVNMHGDWKDDKGTLDELFTYSDGTTQRRIWNLTKVDNNTYSGTAEDVVGEAKGSAYGYALRWEYTMALEVDEEIYHVQFDDWMYLIDSNTVINRSVMSKFGINIGEVILVFIKPGPSNTSNDQKSPFKMPKLSNINHVTSGIL